MKTALRIKCTIILIALLLFGTASFAFAAEDGFPEPVVGIVEDTGIGNGTEPGLMPGGNCDFEIPEPDLILMSADSPDTVYTEAELVNWVNSNYEGTVRLGAVITITDTLFLTAPVTIDTGPFGFVFDKDAIMDFDMASEITGEGVDMPVVEVKETIYTRMGDWNNLLRWLTITATGRDGKGGTALRISAPNQGVLRADDIILLKPGKIRSYGSGAIGVELMVPFDLYGFDIRAYGEGSVALYAHAGGSVHFSRIAADGASVYSEASSPDESSVFAVHNCDASPVVQQDGVLVTRAELSDYPSYYPVRQGSNLNTMIRDFNRLFYTVPFKITDANSRVSTVYIDWDMDALISIDTSKTGTTMIDGELISLASEWFSELLTADWPVHMIIDVRDPDMPCISNVYFYTRYDGVPVAQMVMWTLPPEIRELLILWRSDDGGETWYVCTDDPEVAWINDPIGHLVSIEVELAAISEGAMFQMEASDIGESNIVVFNFADGKINVGAGGDRTGTDRIIGVRPGAEKPAPEPGEGDGDGQGDGDDGSNPGSGYYDGDGGYSGPGAGNGNIVNINSGSDDSGYINSENDIVDDSGRGYNTDAVNDEAETSYEDSAGNPNNNDGQTLLVVIGDAGIPAASLLHVMEVIPASIPGASGVTDPVLAHMPDGQDEPESAETLPNVPIPNAPIPDATIHVPPPNPQPALPETGTGGGVILAVSASVVLLCAAGFFLFGRRKQQTKR